MNERKEALRADFIHKAIAKHRGKYTYDKVVYVNAHTKVIITCEKHGDFSQTPNSHLAPTMCPGCGQEKRAKSKTFTRERFIEKSRSKHGDAYDYSETVYNGAKNPVTIRCRKHGYFNQTAMSHMLGMRCMQCFRESAFDTKEDFIRKAREKHGDEYIYDHVIYVNSITNVEIECREHGKFWQRPHTHLDVKGCKKCKNSRGETALGLLLNSSGDKYDIETRFPTCTSEANCALPFDFHIPKHNLLIEFDGKQHFGIVEHWGGEEGLRKRILHDSIKDNWCLANNKILLRISDKDIKNVGDIINSALDTIKTFIAEEPDPANPRGFIMGTAFYATICTTTNPDGIRDTSQYVII